MPGFPPLSTVRSRQSPSLLIRACVEKPSICPTPIPECAAVSKASRLSRFRWRSPSLSIPFGSLGSQVCSLFFRCQCVCTNLTSGIIDMYLVFSFPEKCRFLFFFFFTLFLVFRLEFQFNLNPCESSSGRFSYLFL